MLQAENQDLKANRNRDASCVVETNVQKGLGTIATTLVKLSQIGDVFVAGEIYGWKEAGTNTAVRVIGFEGLPNEGDILGVVNDEQSTRDSADSRICILREQSSTSFQAGSMNSSSSAFSVKKDRRKICVM